MITSLTTPQPVDFADVRATNLAVVLRYVRSHAPCSRADIAAATGLNKATVSSLVTDLLERRLVRETGLTENRIGRPATMLVLDGSAYAAVGLEVNADYLTAVALDLAGNRLLSWRRSFAGLNVPPGKAVAAVTALARRALTKVTKEERRVLGLTVGVPGLVDPDGVVRVAPNLGWQDVDLRGQLAAVLTESSRREPLASGSGSQASPLASRSGSQASPLASRSGSQASPLGSRSGSQASPFPVSVDNDANLAATAEHRWGAYAGTPNLAYLTGAVGIGAGVITDGRLLRGAHGFVGELGHVQLDPAGPACGCGRRGCLEALAGVAGLLRRANPDSFTDGTPTDWEPEITEVARRARARDKVTLDALAEVGTWLGQGAAVLANVVNPEVIILGGYFVPLAQWLLPAAQAELASRTLAPDAGGARVVASSFGHDAAATGGAATILAAVDAGNLPARR